MKSKLLEQQARIIGFYHGKPVFSVSGAHPAFTVDQTNFAFYNDGTESGAVIIGSIGSDASDLALDTVYQVRFEITETGGAGINNQTWQLEAQVDGGIFFDVTGTSTNVRAAAGAVTDGEDTTQRLGGGGTFVGGDGVDEVDGLAGGALNDWLGSEIGEVLFSFTLRGVDLSGGETINLRLKAMDAYTVADATLTVATPVFEESADYDAGFGFTAVDELANPVLVQDKFRFRYDNGSETLADWIESVDANTILDADRNYRIRYNIRETAGFASSPQFQLQYNKNSGGWNDVNGTSSNVRSFASSNFADGDSTTEQLAGAGTFTAGKMEEVDGRAASITLNNQDTEVEFCFQVRGIDVVDTDVIQLRVIDVATALDTYTVTPQFTVSELSTPTQLDHTEYPKQNFYIGPFETATDKVIFTVDQGGHFLTAMRTTVASPSNTDWSLADSTFVGQIESVYCVEESTNIHIATISTNGRIAYSVFSTSTDLFTTENELVEMPGVISTYDAIATTLACAIIYRTTGPDVMLYASVEDDSTQKIHAWEKNAGSWTAIGNPQALSGVVAGQFTTATGATVWGRGPTGSEISRTRHFDGDANLETEFGPDTTTDNATLIAVPGVSEATDGGCAYIDASNKLSYVQGPSVDATDITANTVYGHGRTTAPFLSGSVVKNGSDVHVLYIDDATQNIRHTESIGDTISWGNDTEILNPTGAVNRLSARLNNAGDGINYVYEEGSTVKFGSFSIAPTIEESVSYGTSLNFTASAEAIYLDFAFYLVSLGFTSDTAGSIYQPSVQSDAQLDFTASAEVVHDPSVQSNAQFDFTASGGILFEASITSNAQFDFTATGEVTKEASVQSDAQFDFTSETGGSIYQPSVQSDAQLDFTASAEVVHELAAAFDVQFDLTATGEVVHDPSATFDIQFDMSAVDELGAATHEESAGYDAGFGFSASAEVVHEPAAAFDVQFDLTATGEVIAENSVTSNIQFDFTAVDELAGGPLEESADYDAGFGFTATGEVVHEPAATFDIEFDHADATGVDSSKSIQSDAQFDFTSDADITKEGSVQSDAGIGFTAGVEVIHNPEALFDIQFDKAESTEFTAENAVTFAMEIDQQSPTQMDMQNEIVFSVGLLSLYVGNWIGTDSVSYGLQISVTALDNIAVTEQPGSVTQLISGESATSSVSGDSAASTCDGDSASIEIST